jgi:glycosyltransferase involved in cell wall biosynthesis
MEPKVSVLIPLYNQERYFKSCIRSVCRQTYKNLEIIIVNDGSTDISPLMAKDWALRDHRVKVIDKQNEGLAFARRDGYLAASGEYVVFLDSDDMLTPQAIKVMIDCALKEGVDLVVGTYEKYIGIINRRMSGEDYSFPFNQVIKQPDLFDKYYVGFFRNDVFPINVWAKLYRKSVIDKAYHETELYSQAVMFMGEDQYFNMKLFPHLNSMYRIKDKVYKYRYGGGTFGFNKNFPQLFSLSDKRLELLDQFNYEKGYEPLFDEYVACVYYHAAQLIHFKKAKKDDVIDFFKYEVQNRKLMLRLLDYYSIKSRNIEAVSLLIERNYEGMYQYACEESLRLFASLKHKVIKVLVELMERFP